MTPQSRWWLFFSKYGLAQFPLAALTDNEQLTGALSHVLPIMISVMTAKWVGDAFGKEGIYSVWIAMRRYPWLPPVEYHDEGETAKNIMKPFADLVVIEDAKDTVRDLGEWDGAMWIEGRY